MSEIIDYRSPPPPQPPAPAVRSPYIWLLLAPILGGIFGLVQGVAIRSIVDPPVSDWPTFVELAPLLCGLGGTGLGLAVGVILAVFETAANRRVRMIRVFLEVGFCVTVLTCIFGFFGNGDPNCDNVMICAIMTGLTTVIFALSRAMATAKQIEQ